MASAAEDHSGREILEEYYRTRDPVEHSASITQGHPAPPKDRPLTRRSVQVADLQRHLAEKHVEGVLRMRTCPSCHVKGSEGAGGDADGANGAKPQPNDVALQVDQPGSPSKNKFEADEQKRAMALYDAALRADQNLKLSIFATRPSINAPLFNLLTEAMGTTALLLLALLIELQARRIPDALRSVYVVGLQPLLITFTIVMLIAGLGGPTAYAANPARDFGPRFAHFLLPIPNKGPSEWSYAWIPVLGPFIGGAAAGGLYMAIEAMSFPGGGVKA